MSRTDRVDAVERVADAVLYEGYILYPYRPGSVKNRVRWTFGGVHPRAYAEANPPESWRMRAECLLEARRGCRLSIEVRFLHLLERAAEGRTWEEATDRRFRYADLALDDLTGRPLRAGIALAARRAQSKGGSRSWRRVDADVEIRAERLPEGVHRVCVEAVNTTAVPGGLPRELALRHSMVSAHAILRASGGDFVSMTDPPPHLLSAAAGCRNAGVWPVLAGEPGSRQAVLASPIILEDHPRVAEESPGDLFDSSEIDEILTLRILTLTEDEKAELRRGDERARRMLERTERLGTEDLLRLHGTVRSLRVVEGAR